MKFVRFPFDLSPLRSCPFKNNQFAAFTKPYVKRRRTVAPDMRAHGLRLKVRAWNKTLRVAKVKGIRSADLREGLRGELAELARFAEGVARKL